MKPLIVLCIYAFAWLFVVLPAKAENRVALVIGNSAYINAGPLPNPRNDAEDVTGALKRLGFEVIEGMDLTVRDFANILLTFSERLKDADVALLFYAGHGMAVDGKNYLIPIDAELNSAADLEIEAISLERIQAHMERRPRTNLLVFDACRNNPFTRRIARALGSRSTAIQTGWAEVNPAKGTYISFATEPGDIASDGIGRNSPFTSALLKHIGTENLDIQLMMRSVRREVIEATGGDQVPWERSSLISSFAFLQKGRQTATPFIASDKSSYAQGDKIRLVITPPEDCRLTLLNVDNTGKSCLLFPHPKLPDTVLKRGERVMFPPKGSLTLDEAGEETFVAMCNASEAAKKKASRNTTQIDCSKGAADRAFNDQFLETVTFSLEDDDPDTKASDAALSEKQTILRGSLTVNVAPQ